MNGAGGGTAGGFGSDYESTLARLVSIWSETLRTADISPESDFFDLGGDSLLALALFLAIERDMGLRFPITTIYDAPTVAEMAKLIVEGTRPHFSPLVLVKPGVAGLPLFLIHGIGGTIVELSALAKHVAIAGPVYAIQALGLDGEDEPLRSIEEMAELYLGCIREQQPKGPYRICGYSFGGLVALEIARRLQRLGEETSPLMLMDAFAHPKTWPVTCRAQMEIRRAVYRLREAAAQPWSKSLAVLNVGAVRTWRRLFRRDAYFQSRLCEWLLDNNPDLPLPLLKVREAGSAALAAYRPGFYPGKVTFLKAAERDPEFPLDPMAVWKGLVKELDVLALPGGHRSIVTEHAADVGAALTACIRKVCEGATDRADGVHVGKRQTLPRFEPQTICP